MADVYRTPGCRPRPTWEQVRDAIANAVGPDGAVGGTVLGYLGDPGVDWATDAVMELIDTRTT